MDGLAFEPLTAARWDDLVRLFGPRGACGNCWCMYWRQRAPQWKARTGAGNRAAFARIVRAGPAPGLLAYADGEPVAWVQVGPREHYARILAARTRQPLDATPSWVISCFYVARSHRGSGLTVRLIAAAAAHARAHGARRVEGFPLSSDQPVAAAFAYVGTPSAFRRAGFARRTQRLAGKPHARWVLDLA